MARLFLYFKDAPTVKTMCGKHSINNVFFWTVQRSLVDCGNCKKAMKKEDK